MKLFTYIKSFFKKKEITIVPLDEMALEELIPKHHEEELIYYERFRELKTQEQYLMSINQLIAKKHSPVKVGDILELNSNNNVGRTVLVQQLFWNKNIEGPVSEIEIICQTWKSKKTSIVLNEKLFSISYSKEKRNDPFSIKSWAVRKNINDRPSELENKVKETVKKVVKL